MRTWSWSTIQFMLAHHLDYRYICSRPRKVGALILGETSQGIVPPALEDRNVMEREAYYRTSKSANKGGWPRECEKTEGRSTGNGIRLHVCIIVSCSSMRALPVSNHIIFKIHIYSPIAYYAYKTSPVAYTPINILTSLSPAFSSPPLSPWPPLSLATGLPLL